MHKNGNIIIQFITFLNEEIIWGMPMVMLLILTGIFLAIKTRFIIFRRFGTVMRYTVGSLFKHKTKTDKGTNEITPFQALCTALAATVGTGNIVGVGLAIAIGGAGAIFWLWISALIGMVLKYCEVTLSVAYSSTDFKGEKSGGAMYYIEKGIGKKWLAVIFSIFTLLASFGTGAAVQANSLSESINASFGISSRVIGILSAAIAGLVVIGGIKRIAAFSEFLVPFMALFYIGGAVTALIFNAAQIPRAFSLIFKCALTGKAAGGGFLGAAVINACKTGMARGVFTHEAGMGSAPIAHASASTDHPARQGLWGAFEVFFDSIVMCTISALVILTSGASASHPKSFATISADAFESTFKGGKYIVSIGLVLFAFATVIAWYYYGEKCAEYLFKGNSFLKRCYQIIYVLIVYFGCISKLDTVWKLADLFNGLMAIPNLIALIILAPAIKNLTSDFFSDPHRIRPKGTNFSNLLIAKNNCSRLS